MELFGENEIVLKNRLSIHPVKSEVMLLNNRYFIGPAPPVLL